MTLQESVEYHARVINEESENLEEAMAMLEEGVEEIQAEHSKLKEEVIIELLKKEIKKFWE